MFLKLFDCATPWYATLKNGKTSFKEYYEKANKLNEETLKMQNVYLVEKSVSATERKRERKIFF